MDPEPHGLGARHGQGERSRHALLHASVPTPVLLCARSRPGQAAEHPSRSQRFCLPLPAQPLVIEEYGKNVTQQTEAAIEQERNPTFRCGHGGARGAAADAA